MSQEDSDKIPLNVFQILIIFIKRGYYPYLPIRFPKMLKLHGF